MLVLGLDPSLRAYGWCVYDSKAGPRTRLVASGHEGTLNSIVPVVRFMHFRSLVRDKIQKYGVEAVGIESPAYGGGPFSEAHFGLMMFSLEAVFENRLDCVLFDPATLKYLAKSDPNKRGVFGKLDMQKYVMMDTNSTKPINNNEADAYCVAHFCSRMIDTVNGNLDPNFLSETEKAVFIGRTKTIKRSSGVKIVKRTAYAFRENNRFFKFSHVPHGNVNLPYKSQINLNLLDFLEKNDLV